MDKKICQSCDRPMEARLKGEDVAWVCPHCDLMDGTE